VSDRTQPALGSRADAVLAREHAALANVLKIRFYPFVAAGAHGVRMVDADGREYLDFTASAGVAQTGYNHPRVRLAIVGELDRQHTSMLCCFGNELAVTLAERLCELVPGDFEKKAWLGTTGSDANDCLSRLLPMATGRRRLITFVGGYHGTTTGSAALSGHQAQAAVIGGGHVTKVPYPDPYRCSFGPCDRDGCSLRCLEYVERFALGATSPAADTAAVVMEAVQSDGGEIVPPANVIPALRELCDRHGIWLVFDEVKTGLGRTGRMFAFEHSEVVPDAVALGKPLGGGLIIGVELVADRETRQPAPIETHRLVYRCFELGLLVIYAGLHGNVVEILPPLTIGEAEVDEGLAIIEQALADVEAGRFDDAKLAPFAGW
jgi:4-aminobutyrate aminotransferase